jgi:4-aminobutyrate aminotransferase/(S)-3-amino-2-methylpropionate transaminase
MADGKHAALLERRNRSVPRGVATAHPIVIERAKNAELWDVGGKRYIDFAGGIGVQNFGHCHPKVVAAVQRQAATCIHVAFQVAAYEPYIALAERLNALAPVEGPAKTILFSTGAEAVENAVKIARLATRRNGAISFVGGFHGRTFMGLALTGKLLPYKKGFGTLPGPVYHAPFPMACHGVTTQDSLRAIDKIFKASLDPGDTAAIVLEPVQGEGGFYIAPPEFLQELRRLCTAHGIQLISDEVQSGFGRTGKLFAIEHSGVRPDLVTAAKSIAGGLPLSAVIGRAELMDAPEPGGLGGTYGGNPLACAAALAVLDVIEEEGLLARSAELGRQLVDGLHAAIGGLPCVGEIRGLGGMVAFELVSDRATHAPDAALAKRLCVEALERGLVLLSCGVYGNVIRILVPITAPREQVDEGVRIIRNALERIAAGASHGH